jgi:serine/threonine protein kinase
MLNLVTYKYMDRERLARFEWEARLLASLNHPNIATIHGLEKSDDQQFLVMELVEGETLRDRLTLSSVARRLRRTERSEFKNN